MMRSALFLKNGSGLGKVGYHGRVRDISDNGTWMKMVIVEIERKNEIEICLGTRIKRDL